MFNFTIFHVTFIILLNFKIQYGMAAELLALMGFKYEYSQYWLYTLEPKLLTLVIFSNCIIHPLTSEGFSKIQFVDETN